MKSSTATVLAALLVAVVLVAPSAAASPRRALLNSCEDECTKTYEDNVKKCIAETKLGEPPALEKKQAVAMGALAYVPPKDTGGAHCCDKLTSVALGSSWAHCVCAALKTC